MTTPLVSRALSPHTCLSLLLIFNREKTFKMSAVVFEQCFDVLMDVLSNANDNKYRVHAAITDVKE